MSPREALMILDKASSLAALSRSETFQVITAGRVLDEVLKAMEKAADTKAPTKASAAPVVDAKTAKKAAAAAKKAAKKVGKLKAVAQPTGDKA